MRVQLFGEAANGGISRDLALLSAALSACGCKVTVRACGKLERRRRRSALTRWRVRSQFWRRRRAGDMAGGTPFDLNVMLEHVWPQFLGDAHRNVLVPNPEWFDPRDVSYLWAFDRVWVKTAVAERLFRERGCATSVIGFDSDDRAEPSVGRVDEFLHVAGRSPLKGTARLLALWQGHPEWPRLTIVQDAGMPGGKPLATTGAPNIAYRGGYLSDSALRVLQNAHRFHVCTSEAEGWGHYIVEAMSVGAVTLTCDAAPMNELIALGRGLPVAAHPGPIHNLAQLSLFDESALEAAIGHAMSLSVEELESIGRAARGWFVENKADFLPRVGRALRQLNASALH